MNAITRCRTGKVTMFWALTIIASACVPEAHGANPNKPGGGGGGGSSTAPYRLVLLAPLDAPFTWGAPWDVNDAGNVVGYYNTSDGPGLSCAYHYDLAGNTFVTLAGGTHARGVNNSGEIVGWNYVSSGVSDTAGESDAVYWSSAAAAPVTLEGLADSTQSRAWSINDAGLIGGWSIVGTTQYAVLWRRGSADVAAVLPPLPAAPHAQVLRVSGFDADGVARAVGYSSLTQSGEGDGLETARATLWEVRVDAAGMLHVSVAIDLGVLTDGPSVAWSVNAFGDACGDSDAWPFVKPAGQFIQPLPPVGSKAGTMYGGRAWDIDEAGNTVGDGYFSKPGWPVRFRACLWSAGQGTDLNGQVKLGRDERLEFATAISNSGHIVGRGYFAQDTVGYLLVPNAP